MQNYIDLGLSGCDSYEVHGAPMRSWDEAVLPGFGSYINQFGYMGNVEHIQVEVLPEDFGSDGTYITPMMELSPDDYKYMEAVNYPYVGMRAISDLGDLYEYTEAPPELGGRLKRFFKKIGRGIKKGVKKVGSGIKKGFKSLMHKTKFGKAILKIGKKIIEVSKKVIMKLAKVVGKWATRLAPLAAMIPGYGPAIAGALLAAGAIAKVIVKVGGTVKKVKAIVDGEAGVVDALELTDSQAAQMTKDLKLEAAKMSKRPKKEIDALNAKLRATDPDVAGPPKPMAKILAAKAAFDAARAKLRALEQAKASMRSRRMKMAAGLKAIKSAKDAKIAEQAKRSRRAAQAAGKAAAAVKIRQASAAGARHAAQQRMLEQQRQAVTRRGRPTIAKMQAAAAQAKREEISSLMAQLKKLGVQLPG